MQLLNTQHLSTWTGMKLCSFTALKNSKLSFKILFNQTRLNDFNFIIRRFQQSAATSKWLVRLSRRIFLPRCWLMPALKWPSKKNSSKTSDKHWDSRKLQVTGNVQINNVPAFLPSIYRCSGVVHKFELPRDIYACVYCIC